MLNRPLLSHPHIRRLAMVATCLCVAVIVWASLMPSSALPSVSGSDKMKHFIAYFGLAIPMLVWFGRERWLYVVALVLACGASVEFAQAMGRAGRHAEMLDMVANTLGTLCGTAAALCAFEIDRQVARLKS